MMVWALEDALAAASNWPKSTWIWATAMSAAASDFVSPDF
eukprot:CAMPEP_0175258622 /NCGR_PEP_ID=MMETSP0093-20121207/39323_1 /TAXON_ID=311494 /ORGANISM="Alexandrium monilatum, Strain CCMP3105" /LENGTH=39 /DNA_ID= /DNA_START= /DNA_END= /DNA_ORIENTATION=